VAVPEDYTLICKLEELKDDSVSRFIIDGLDIVLLLNNGQVSALSNICPHYHIPAMHNGFIENDKIVCGYHGWEFNIKDGCMHNGAKGLDNYSVMIEEGKVFVRLIHKKNLWKF